MNDASKKDHKSGKGLFPRSLFSHDDQADAPHSDIDVPEYDGQAVAESENNEKPTAGKPKTSTAAGAPPAAPGPKIAPPVADAGQPNADKLATNEAKAENTQAEKPADEPAAREEKPLPEATETTADDESSPTAETVTSAADSSERRHRDIYELAGRARPQRITAPEPKPAEEPAAQAPESDAAAATAAVGTKEDLSEQQTEVLDLNKRGPEPDDPVTESLPAEAATVAGTGATAGAGAAGAGLAGASAQTGDPAGDKSAADEHATAVITTDGAADGAAAGAAEQSADDSAATTADREESKPEDKRGTQSFGLGILRVVAGVMLLIMGLQTLFGFAGDPGIDGLETRFAELSGAGILAVAIPVAEVVAGVLLILGLLTPLGAALGFVVAAFMATFHLNGSNGSLWPYSLNPVVHQWSLYALITLSLIFTGPGRGALDRKRGWATRPLASAWIFAILGIAAYVALWLLAGATNPLT